jgi:hypothetical protein
MNKLDGKAYVDPIEIRNAKIAGTIKFYVDGDNICCTDNSCVVYVGEINKNSAREEISKIFDSEISVAEHDMETTTYIEWLERFKAKVLDYL